MEIETNVIRLYFIGAIQTNNQGGD